MSLDFITTIRKKKELSIKELASLANISATRLGKIERNKVDPKLSEIAALMKVLDHKIVAKDAINHYRHEEYVCVNGK